MKDFRIPDSLRGRSAKTGETVRIAYRSRVYNPELPEFGREYEKYARIYLPHGYGEGRQYNTVYVLHGGGGDDYYDWLHETDPNPVWILENLVQAGLTEPCVLVFPNCRSDLNQEKGHLNWFSSYSFGPDLRDDLIPAIEARFSVRKERSGRALCGLSLGGFQTAQIGIGELYGLFASYGVFSASFNGGNGMTFSAEKALGIIEGSKETLGCLYMLCGTDDRLCFGTYSRDITLLSRMLPSHSRIRESGNYIHEEAEGGGHDYKVWQYGLYRFLQLAFKTSIGG